MNKRKFKRKNSLSIAPSSPKQMNMNMAAKAIVFDAAVGKQRIKRVGNFIFFSTNSGDAWMLDHRENLALQLADNFESLQYTIIEDDKRFLVEWTEKFEIREDTFASIKSTGERLFFDYPTKNLQDLIMTLQ